LTVHVQRNEAENEVEERNDWCVAEADKTESVSDNVSDSASTKQTGDLRSNSYWVAKSKVWTPSVVSVCLTTRRSYNSVFTCLVTR